LLAFVSALAAAGLGEIAPLASLGGTGGLALFLGVSGFLAARSMRGVPGARDGVAMLLIAWTTAPALAALPFLGAPGIETYGDAYFEAMTAISTTGRGLIDLEAMPRSLIVWRALLEWAGGFMSVVLILVILAALNLTGPGVHRSTLFTMEDGSMFGRFSEILQASALVYVLATLAGFVILATLGTPAFDAFYLAVTAPATSGGYLRPEPLAAHVPPAGLLAVSVAMMAGAVNFALVWRSYRDPTARAELWRDPETRALLIAALLIAAALMLTGAIGGRAAPINAIHDAVALVSTTARFADPDSVRRLPPVLILVVTFVGGSAISTAGGVKIIRMLLLFSHVWVELRRVSHPSGVVLMNFRGRRLADRAFISLWVYFLGFTGALGALTLAVTLSGANFASSVAAAVAALSNAGGILPVVTPEQLDFGDFPRAARWCLALGMGLGRMEVLAFIAAFTPGLWRR
jgi:trk system potassium uptake protein TrkH